MTTPNSVDPSETSSVSESVDSEVRELASGDVSGKLLMFPSLPRSKSANAAANASAVDEHRLLSKLRNLDLLLSEGFVSQAEYKERRRQIVDRMTGTSSVTSRTTSTSYHRRQRTRGSSRSFSPVVIPRPPPDFSNIVPEAAIKHTFDLETRQWTSRPIMVRLDDTPFARGGLRLVFHLQEEGGPGAEPESPRLVSSTLSNFQAQPTRFRTTATANSSSTTRVTYCAKIAIDPDENTSTYFADVELQAHCGHFANKFNACSPPRPVEFVKCWLLELVEREGRPLCAVEVFIPGPYRKHNNNYGFVCDDERNTPQAFSHFTFEASSHTLLVVDVQGVGDRYTDPQLHTLSGRDFGKGNLGKRGFDKFMSTHQCNSICRYLRLPEINPNADDDGRTVPDFERMPDELERSRFEGYHAFETEPMLQKYFVPKPRTRPPAVVRRPRPASARDDDRCCGSWWLFWC